MANEKDVEAGHGQMAPDPTADQDPYDVVNQAAKADKKAVLVAVGACVACQILLYIGLGVFWLVVYLKYKDARCEDPLPTWCLVNCIMIFCSMPFACATALVKKHGLQKAKMGQQSASMIVVSCISCLLGIFHFVWFILGNIWAWGQDWTQCNINLLEICRGYLIACYCLLGIVYCCGCLGGCAGAAKSGR